MHHRLLTVLTHQQARLLRVEAHTSHSYLLSPMVYDFHDIIFLKFTFYSNDACLLYTSDAADE